MTKEATKNIPEGWKETTLGEVAEVIGGGTPKTSNAEYWNGDIPWLSVVDFNDDKRWVYKTEKAITKKGLENSSTKLLNASDLIISARGTVGAFAQLKTPMAFNQSCYGLRAKEDSFNDFLFYLIKFNAKQFQRNVHGAVFDTITRETFDQIQIFLPPLPEQKAIAAVLSSFDDKIELLREQNKTLEATAQAIFKRWFVDFEFPLITTPSSIDATPREETTPSLRATPPREGNNSLSVEGWQAEPDGVIKFPSAGGVVSSRNTKQYMFLPYNPKLKEKAKELRKAGNLSEVLLWQQVKNKQFRKLDFDRQKIIGDYIVDFYCPNLGLVIEIDGSSHDEKFEYDQARDEYLKSLDLVVIHIQDKDVKKNLAGVMKYLDEKVEEVTTPSSIDATPRKETTPPRWGTPPWEGNSPSVKGCPKGGVVGYKSSGGKMIDSELGEIPEGWRVGKLKELVEIKNGFAFKSEDYINDKQCPIVRTVNFEDSGYVNNNSLVYISYEKAEEYQSFNLEEFDLCVVMVGASLGETALITKINMPALQNQNMWSFKPINQHHRFYNNFQILNLINQNIKSASGSARDFFRKDHFYNIDVLIPSDSIISRFEEIIRPIYSKISNNLSQTQTLSVLRDALLPKLMKGEVRVKGFND